MLNLLHDPEVYASTRTRMQSLRVDTQRQWGKMSIDQMLWHVNLSLDMALGRAKPASVKPPLPGPVMRFLVLNVPWPKGMPTHPEAIANQHYDFDAERARCLSLIDEVGAVDLDARWPEHPAFGVMAGHHWSAFNAKHLHHHLKQFGA